jgi:hypothetical protein
MPRLMVGSRFSHGTKSFIRKLTLTLRFVIVTDEEEEDRQDKKLSPSDRYISDKIKVEIIPEKRGVFLKHTEYQVSDE